MLSATQVANIDLIHQKHVMRLLKLHYENLASLVGKGSCLKPEKGKMHSEQENEAVFKRLQTFVSIIKFILNVEGFTVGFYITSQILSFR